MNVIPNLVVGVNVRRYTARSAVVQPMVLDLQISAIRRAFASWDL
jgi:hypothetical protein